MIRLILNYLLCFYNSVILYFVNINSVEKNAGHLKKRFSDEDLESYIFYKIQSNKRQSFQSKLRMRQINKKCNEKFRKSIKKANLKYYEFNSLHKICFREQIQKISFKIPELYVPEFKFDDLQFVSSQYFPNLKRVELFCGNKVYQNYYDQFYQFLFNTNNYTLPRINIELQEDFSVQGIVFTSQNIYLRFFSNNHSLNISDAKFDHVYLGIKNAENVQVKNTKFLIGDKNPENLSSAFYNPESLHDPQYAISFSEIPNFALEKIHVQNHYGGLYVSKSNGQIFNSLFENCGVTTVGFFGLDIVQQSLVQYRNIQFEGHSLQWDEDMGPGFNNNTAVTDSSSNYDELA